MRGSTSVASYLFKRLRQVGVNHVFGVPGDFTLKALDHVKAAGSKFVVNCNELNAGYAADGYARTKGLGALFTTYGVGELSAINAVAGSFAEHVPVVHIVGLPQRSLIASKAVVHHTLGDGNMHVFQDMYAKITHHRSFLRDPEKAGEEIDLAIKVALGSSQPTYIGLPCDMVNEQIDADALDEPLLAADNTSYLKKFEMVISKLRPLIQDAERPVLLVDRGMGVDSIRDEINTFVRESGIPTLTMPSGAGMIDHSIPNYFGVHAGPVGQFDTMSFVKSADLLIEFGPMYSDTQTLGFSTVPNLPNTVTISKNNIRFPDGNFQKVPMDYVIKRLAIQMQPVKAKSLEKAVRLPDFRSFPITKPLRKEENPVITQDKLYLRLNSYLRPHDIILLANATPILGGRDFVLPDASCRVIVSGLWFSIGHMLPAALGAGLAQQQSGSGSGQGRVVLFDGDGSFQVTAQELSTIIRYRLNMTIFIINNGGYAYERLIHNADADYHDIAPWHYQTLPKVFGGGAAVNAGKLVDEDYTFQTTALRSWQSLEAFLTAERFDNGYGGKGRRGLRLVEIKVGPTDVPEKFRKVFESAGQKLG